MKSLGQIAYEAYWKQAGGVSLVSGDKLPEFQNLKIEIRQAWDAAATAVLLVAAKEIGEALEKIEG